MRYLAIYKAEETEKPPTAEHMANMGALIEEMTRAGVLLSTEGCMASRHGFRARRKNGKVKVTDGPFTESKEVVGGFAIFQVATREEAIEWTRRFLEVAGEGESEVRRLRDA